MKFTKTVVAVAVTGLFAVPLAASAETTLSGLVQIKVQGFDDDNIDGDAGDPETAAGDVRVAINTQQALTSGLTGYGNIQFNLDNLTGEGGINQTVAVETPVDPNDPGFDPANPFSRDDVNIGSSATVASDNIYVGVKGGFGDFRWGEIPLAVEYGQLANDIHDIGATVVDGLSYTGTFGPATIGVNYSLENDSDMAGIGAKFAFGGVTFGLGYESRNLGGDGSDNLAAGASFALAGFSIGAQYWIKGLAGEDLQTSDDEENIAVKVGYSIAGVSLGLTYSLLNNAGFVSDNEESQIRLDAGYDLGGGMDISTRINLLDRNGNEDGEEDFDNSRTDYRVMLTKNF